LGTGGISSGVDFGTQAGYAAASIYFDLAVEAKAADPSYSWNITARYALGNAADAGYSKKQASC
jgi:hypothetical protein